LKKTRITSLGKLLLLIAAFLYLAMVTSRSSLLLFPLSIILGCLGYNFLEVRKAEKKLKFTFPRYQAVPEKGNVKANWRVEGGRVGKTFPFKLFLSGREIYSNRGPGSIVFSPDLKALRRGVYDLSRMECHFRGSFGLVEKRSVAGSDGELAVYPALFNTIAPLSGAFDSVLGGKSKGHRWVNSGTHFAGVRPMQPGDSLKQIHWRTSSKGRGMMVKQFEQELTGRVSIITDCSRNAEVLDDALRATGSLVMAAQDAGEHVDWMLLSDQYPILNIAPFTDPGEVLDRLSRISGVDATPDFEQVRAALETVHRRSAITLVLQREYDWVPLLVDWSRAKHRKISLYYPELAQPSIPSGVHVFKYGGQQIWEI